MSIGNPLDVCLEVESYYLTLVQTKITPTVGQGMAWRVKDTKKDGINQKNKAKYFRLINLKCIYNRNMHVGQGETFTDINLKLGGIYRINLQNVIVIWNAL